MANKLSVGILVGAALDKTFGRTMGQAYSKTGKLGDALQQISKKKLSIKGLQSSERELDELRGSLTAANRSVMQLKKRMAGGAGGAEFESQLAAAQRRAAGLGVKVEKARHKIDRAKDAMRASGVTVGNYGNQLNQLGRSYDRLARKQRRFAKLESAKNKFGQARGKAMGAAVAAGAGGYAAARFLGPGVEFERKMSKVQALTGLGKGNEQLKGLKTQAQQLGGSTAFSATEVAGGQGFLAMAGYKAAEIKAAMPAVLNMALAGGTDIEETADIASNILSGFGLKAIETARVGDVLAKTTGNSNVKLEELAHTMKYVAPIASAAGASIEEASAMAAKLGSSAIKSGQAGTALRAIFSRLAGPPAQAAKALAYLGVKTKDSAGNMRPMFKVLSEIQNKTKDMGSGDRLAIYKHIAGEEAATAFTILTEQASTGGLAKFENMLKNSAGTSAQLAKTMTDNMGGDLTSLGSAWESVSIGVFQALKPALRTVVQGLTSMTRAVAGFAEENPRLVRTVLMVGGALASLWAAKSIFTMLALGIKVVGLAFTLSPIGIAIGVIVAAGVALVANWDWVSAKATAIWDGVGSFFSGIWNHITSVFDGGIVSIGAAILNFSPFSLFYKAFSGVLNWFGVELPDTFTGFGSMLVDGLVSGITSIFPNVTQAISSLGSTIKDTFTSLLGINSPSKVFKGFGINIGEGAEQGMGAKLASMAKASGRLGLAAAGASIALGAGTGASAAAGVSGVKPSGQAVVYHNNNSNSNNQISITVVQGAGESTEELAQRVAALIEQQSGFRARSAMADIG